jgi:hypothetical protein
MSTLGFTEEFRSRSLTPGLREQIENATTTKQLSQYGAFCDRLDNNVMVYKHRGLGSVEIRFISTGGYGVRKV